MDETGPTLTQRYGEYVSHLFAREDGALMHARESSKRDGLPSIQVSASSGKLIQMLARMVDAKRILEIGTLGGYSAIWLARALSPEGRLISLELDEHHAEVARANLANAGLEQRVEVRVGPALETLGKMKSEDAFDVAFIDADKDSYPAYLEHVIPLVRRGGLILADNALNERLLEADPSGGIAAYNSAVASMAKLETIIVPTLQSRGLDGIAVSYKRA